MLTLTSVLDGSPVNSVGTSSIFVLGAESIDRRRKSRRLLLDGKMESVTFRLPKYIHCPTAVENETIINDLRVLRAVSGGFSTKCVCIVVVRRSSTTDLRSTAFNDSANVRSWAILIAFESQQQTELIKIFFLNCRSYGLEGSATRFALDALGIARLCTCIQRPAGECA